MSLKEEDYEQFAEIIKSFECTYGEDKLLKFEVFLRGWCAAIRQSKNKV